MNAYVSNAGMTNFEPLGDPAYEGTVSTTVLVMGTDITMPAKARCALVSVKAQAVNVTFDGSTPAASGAGLQLAVGLYYFGEAMLRNMRLVRAAGSDATVRIEWGS